MKLCVPVENKKELESTISLHFGHAPYFAIIDTDDFSIDFIKNKNEKHSHGDCKPLESINGLEFDAVVVASIGSGASFKLKEAGYNVYKTSSKKLSDLILDYKNDKLEEVGTHNTCAAGKHDFSCSE